MDHKLDHSDSASCSQAHTAQVTSLVCSADMESQTLDRLAELSLEDLKAKSPPIQFTKLIDTFDDWDEEHQVCFIHELLNRMGHFQLGAVDRFLRPMLQRDFIANLPRCVSDMILLKLDAKGLTACETVSKDWRRALAFGQHWRKLIESRIRSDSMWKGLTEKRNWNRFFFVPRDKALREICNEGKLDYDAVRADTENLFLVLHAFYRRLFPCIEAEISRVEDNWRNGRHTLTRINCQSENSKGVYCIQYDDDKIVSGLRDNTIKVWDRKNLRCSKILSGHTGSVLCLQYDDRVIISGSSDSTVRVWDVKTGECLQTLLHHCEAVLHLRFNNGTMVTCSKDRSIAVWDIISPKDIRIKGTLMGHRAAVNVVDFDNIHIVSASGDRTIRVWNAQTCESIRTLLGHRRGIACLQYRDRLVVSGSSDNTIRLWDIICGACLRVLEGHDELVRCIRFDSKRIVSGAYDGKIKVWDLQAAMDPKASAGSLCLATLNQHNGRVFRLQFDEFQIVSSSHDDTILICNFLEDAPVDEWSAEQARQNIENVRPAFLIPEIRGIHVNRQRLQNRPPARLLYDLENENEEEDHDDDEEDENENDNNVPRALFGREMN